MQYLLAAQLDDTYLAEVELPRTPLKVEPVTVGQVAL